MYFIIVFDCFCIEILLDIIMGFYKELLEFFIEVDIIIVGGEIFIVLINDK